MLGYSGYSFNRACNWLLKPNISEAVEYLEANQRLQGSEPVSCW